jgi:hypothetical protein
MILNGCYVVSGKEHRKEIDKMVWPYLTNEGLKYY